MNFDLTKKERKIVFAGALSVMLFWAAFSLELLFLLLILCLAISSGSWYVHIPGSVINFYIGANSLFFLSGISYFLLYYRVRCRRCGFAVLRKPGLGTKDLVIHPSLVKTPVIGPWGYQMLQVVRRHKIRCLKCGEDYQLA